MEEYAKKCLQEQETREHGNRLLKVAKEKNQQNSLGGNFTGDQCITRLITIYTIFYSFIEYYPHHTLEYLVMFIVTGQRSEPEGKEKSFVFEEPINHFTTESRNIKEKSIETLEGSHLSMEEWLINHDEDFND